ncbi:Clavaminate synthase-like protein [Marasmius fiardii PR-910]|nr:Clavaminate synthase-like protein [Marasmius fiardii PR-910]
MLKAERSGAIISSDTERRNLTPWAFPTETGCIPEDQYVDLEVIDLADFREYDQETPELSLTPEQYKVQDDLIKKVRTALQSVGFIAMKGHGLTSGDIQRQFDIGRLLNYDVPEEEKYLLHAQIAQEGSWAGYKPRGYYRRPDGAKDNLQHYDLYPFTAVKSRLPEAAQPYLADIRKFIKHNHYAILRKLLAIISLGLGLERETLWHLHHCDENECDIEESPEEQISWWHSKDHLRYAMYYPPSAEDCKKREGLTIPGHTDIGSVTFFYSQPVAGLQVLTPNRGWRYVRHYPDHIIVDLGDSMEFLTGGALKAPPHRGGCYFSCAVFKG